MQLTNQCCGGRAIPFWGSEHNPPKSGQPLNGSHAYPVCHREERSNAAISFPPRGGVRCPNEIAALRSQ